MVKEYIKVRLIKKGYTGKEFTSDEIIEMLPYELKVENKVYHLAIDKINNVTFLSAYWDKTYDHYISDHVAVTMFESLANLWHELKEQGII